jgi:hypothetical protein
MRMILSDVEYNLLNRIASQTKMDCWFSLGITKYGSDCVIDLEEDKVLTLRQGISMLNEGIVPELLTLTDREIEVYANLLQELDIDENPFEEYLKMIEEIYAGNANGICTEED